MIAGFGSIGRRHFRNLKTLGCEEFVFFRSRQGTIEDDEIRGFPATTDLEEALSHKPRVAVIANPSGLHMQVAVKAAESGCDLYIEKPLSHTEDGVESLQKFVDQNRLVAMIGCQYRFHPLLIELYHGIAAGKLGRIAGADACWGEYLPAWHPWEDHRQSYSSRAELGGGVILTLIHPLDYLQWFFGPANRVKAITAAVPSLETPAGEDWADLVLEYPDRIVAHVHLDYLQRPATHQLRVIGSEGCAEWNYHAGMLTWTMADGTVETKQVAAGFDRNDMFLDAMKHFLDCVRDRSRPVVSLADGVQTLRTALLARASAN